MVEKEIHQTDGNGGGVSNPNISDKENDKGLWWIGGFLLALVVTAIVLAII
jgi:hypothetical protein